MIFFTLGMVTELGFKNGYGLRTSFGWIFDFTWFLTGFGAFIELNLCLVRGRGGNSCSRVGFVSCRLISIRLYGLTLIGYVY